MQALFFGRSGGFIYFQCNRIKQIIGGIIMEKRMGNRNFSKYITLSVLGMLGSSGTILADTFFIANKLGADGLAALNLSVSVFGLINGLGMMLGIGGAARYAICKSKGENQEADRTFTLALLTAVFCGVVLIICGTLFSGPAVRLLGADSHIVPMCQSYLRTVLCFAPFFILNHFFIHFSEMTAVRSLQ